MWCGVTSLTHVIPVKTRLTVKYQSCERGNWIWIVWVRKNEMVCDGSWNLRRIRQKVHPADREKSYCCTRLFYCYPLSLFNHLPPKKERKQSLSSNKEEQTKATDWEKEASSKPDWHRQTKQEDHFSDQVHLSQMRENKQNVTKQMVKMIWIWSFLFFFYPSATWRPWFELWWRWWISLLILYYILSLTLSLSSAREMIMMIMQREKNTHRYVTTNMSCKECLLLHSSLLDSHSTSEITR